MTTLACPGCRARLALGPGPGEAECPRCRSRLGVAGVAAELPPSGDDPATRSPGAAEAAGPGFSPTRATSPTPPTTPGGRASSARSAPASPPSSDARPPGEAIDGLTEARADPRRRVGHYTLLGELGKGGMGVVSRAWDEKLGRVVALKLVSGSASEVALERFRREAQAVARLRHPGIVAVHEVGEHGGAPYLAMDCIEGATLDRERLPLERAVEVLREVALAVHHAHERGVVHRDLKPHNIILDASGRALVLDFGIAKLRGASGLTNTGVIVGTPAYMSPEQADASEDLDPRADVYSLGATLYHAVTGRAPFGGSEVQILTHLFMREPDPPSALNRRAAGDLETIILKCLEKEPARRYQSAADLAAELGRYQRGEPLLARPLGRLGRLGRAARRNARVIAAALLAATLTAAAVAYPLAVVPALERRAGAEAARREELAAAAAAARAAAVGGDTRAALAALDPGAGEVEARLDPLEARLAPGALARELGAAAREAGGPDLPDERIAALAAAAQGGLDVAALEAALLRARADARARPGATGARDEARDEVRAAEVARLRARAYRLDPGGADGAGALLDIATDVARRDDPTRALGLLRTLLSRARLPAAVRAEADLGAGTCALALGEAPLARAHLARALERGALTPARARRARVALALAERLAAVSTAPIDAVELAAGPLSPGDGPPDLVVVARDGRVHALRATDGRLEEPGPPLDLGLPLGPQHQRLAIARTPRGARAVVPLWREGGQLALLRLEGGALACDALVRVDDRADLTRLEVLATGDLDGSGADALVLAARPASRPDEVLVPFVLFDPLGAREVVQLEGAPGYAPTEAVWELAATVAALGGRRQVVLGRGEWQGLDLSVYELEGRRARRVLRESLGNPRGLGRAGTRERPCVLAAFDRAAWSDGRFYDRDDLHPDRPDAVWRLEAGPDGVVALAPAPLVSRPFEEREAWMFAAEGSAGGFVPDAPELVPVLETGPRGASLVFADGAGEPLRFGFTRPGFGGKVLLADLDRDGRPELVVNTSPLVAFGLAAAAGPPGPLRDPDPTEGSRLDVALDLLACGLPAEAEVELRRLLAAPDELPRAPDRARARLALMQALSLQVGADGARARRLGEEVQAAASELALADPRASKDALLLAARCAEGQEDFPAALRALDRLATFEVVGPDEARELARLRQRVVPLAGLRDVWRLGPTTTSLPGLVVGDPTLVRLAPPAGARPALLSVRQRPGQRGRLFEAPFTWSGEALRLRARVVPLHVEYDTHLRVGLRLGEVVAWLDLSVHGGGNVDTWQRAVTFSTGPAPVTHPVLVALEDLDATPVALSLTYSPADAAFDLAVARGERLERRRVPALRPLPGGPAALVLETGAKAEDAPGTACAVFDLEALSLEGASEEGTRLAPPPPAGSPAEARAAFSLGPAARAAELLEALEVAGPARVEARLLAALARARAGEHEAAVARLVALHEEDGPALEARALASVDALRPLERAALAAALGRWSGLSPRAMAERGAALAPLPLLDAMSRGAGRPRPHEALLWLEAAGAEADRFPVQRALALSGFPQGPSPDREGTPADDAAALVLLEPLAGSSPAIAWEAGYLAFELGRYALAEALWARLEGLPPRLADALRPFRVRARRLAAR